MTNRQRAAMETRRRLLETGKRLIAQQGFCNVSIDDIVKACGVARGTFYTYFRNKEDIVQAISCQPCGDIEAVIEEIDGTAEEKLCCYVREFTARIQRHGLKITQQWVKNVIDPDVSLEERGGRKLNDDLECLGGILREEVRRGALKDDTPVQAISRLTITQLYGIMTCWCMSDGAIDADTLLEDYCELQLKAMLSPYIR